MKEGKHSKKINPFDLHSVAKNTHPTPQRNIASLRSWDIYSAGGKNSTVAKRTGNAKGK